MFKDKYDFLIFGFLIILVLDENVEIVDMLGYEEGGFKVWICVVDLVVYKVS